MPPSVRVTHTGSGRSVLQDRHIHKRSSLKAQHSRCTDRTSTLPDAAELPPSFDLSRRWLLLASSTAIASLLGHRAPDAAAAAAVAQRVRSERWDTPAVLTVLNHYGVPIKAYWLNYDGVAELCNVLAPGASWTVETYATHPWRFVDSTTGGVVQEWVAQGPGHAVVDVTAGPTLAGLGGDGGEGAAQQQPPSVAQQAGQEPPGPKAVAASAAEGTEPGAELAAEPECEGFDGIGNTREQYVRAKVLHVSMGPVGGVVTLGVEGGPAPLDIYVGLPEAATMFLALGVELRRPQTSLTWINTLKAVGARVDRVLITRIVGETFYARIVLSLPGGAQHSVDSRPSDSLALALQSTAPVFMAKEVARMLLGGGEGLAPPAAAAAAVAGQPDDGSQAPAPLGSEAAGPAIPRPPPTIPGGPHEPDLWMRDAKQA